MRDVVRLFVAAVVCVLPLRADAETSDFICQVTASDRVEIASPVSGILESIVADRGDRVTKGQVVAALKADVERAEVNLAEARAGAVSIVKSKETQLAFEQRKLDRNLDLRQRNMISEHDFDQMSTQRDTAALEIEAARDGQRVAQLELERARAQLALRTIKSPVNGLVTARNLSPGNLVGERPIMVVERTDPLYIEVALPVALFGRVQPGMRLPVTFEVPGVPSRDVEVALVDTTVDAASNTFGVRLLLPNADNTVPAGVKCRVRLGAAMAAAPYR